VQKKPLSLIHDQFHRVQLVPCITMIYKLTLLGKVAPLASHLPVPGLQIQLPLLTIHMWFPRLVRKGLSPET